MMSVLPPHPNIVQNLIAFEDEEFLHIIMEKCHLGDLFKLIKLATKLPEATATSIFRWVLIGFKSFRIELVLMFSSIFLLPENLPLLCFFVIQMELSIVI